MRINKLIYRILDVGLHFVNTNQRICLWNVSFSAKKNSIKLISRLFTGMLIDYCHNDSIWWHNLTLRTKSNTWSKSAGRAQSDNPIFQNFYRKWRFSWQSSDHNFGETIGRGSQWVERRSQKKTQVHWQALLDTASDVITASSQDNAGTPTKERKFESRHWYQAIQIPRTQVPGS